MFCREQQHVRNQETLREVLGASEIIAHADVNNGQFGACTMSSLRMQLPLAIPFVRG
jgi:hypothetical protein